MDRYKTVPPVAATGSYPDEEWAWRVVETDNLGGDYPNEKFVNVPLTSRKHAQKIADTINAMFEGFPTVPRFWKVVDKDYRLQPGFAP